MKQTNKFILFIVINLIITFLVPVLFGVGIISVLTSNGLWILPLLVVLFGVLVGYLISLFIKKDRESSAYLWGQIPPSLLLLVLMTNGNYNSWKYRTNEMNMDANRDVMQYQVNDDEPHIRIAFNKLEASFPSPNDFILQSFSVRTKDTIINAVQDTLYTVYFTYYLNKSKDVERLAKLTVHRDTAELYFIHRLAERNEGYQKARQTLREENKEAIEVGEKIMRQMQEQGDQAVIDALTKSIK